MTAYAGSSSVSCIDIAGDGDEHNSSQDNDDSNNENHFNKCEASFGLNNFMHA